MRSMKYECLNRMIFIGQASPRRAVAEYMSHYHAERNHQRLSHQLIRSTACIATNDGAVDKRQRLGGMLNYYYLVAA